MALSTRMLTVKVPSNSEGPSWAGHTSAAALLQLTWVEAGVFWRTQGGDSWSSLLFLGSCSDSLWLLQSMESRSRVGSVRGERGERTTWILKAAPERSEAFLPNRGYTPAREWRQISLGDRKYLSETAYGTLSCNRTTGLNTPISKKNLKLVYVKILSLPLQCPVTSNTTWWHFWFEVRTKYFAVRQHCYGENSHQGAPGKDKRSPSSLLHAHRFLLLHLSPVGSYSMLTSASLPSEYDLATPSRVHWEEAGGNSRGREATGTNSCVFSVPEFQRGQWSCQYHSPNSQWISTSLACWILN